MWIKKGIVFALLVAGAVASLESFDGGNEFSNPSTYGLEDTFRGIIEGLRNQLKEGIPEKNIPPLDPLNVTYQLIDLAFKDILDLKGFLKDVSGANLLSFNITKLKANLVPISFEIRLVWEPINMAGQYNMTGNLLNVIPIYGNGPFSAYLEGVFGYFRIDVGTKAGQLLVKKMEVDFGVRNVTVKIDNFLGGVLGDVVCEIINENLPTMVEQFKIGYLQDIKNALVKEINAFIKDKTPQDILDIILGMFSTTTPAPTTPQPTSAAS